MLSVGLGPFEDRWGERLAKWLLHLTYFVSVRDTSSQEWLEQVGYPAGKYLRCHDAALFLAREQQSATGPTLGVSLLPYFANYTGSSVKDHELVQALTAVLRAWRRIHPDGEVHLCSFLKQDSIFSDNRVLLPLRDSLGNVDWVFIHDDVPDLATTFHLFSTFTHFISMRYHAEALAWLHEVPQLCIIYHQKNRMFAQEYGIKVNACFEVEEVCDGEMLATAEAFFKDPQQFAATSCWKKIAATRNSILPLEVTVQNR